MKIGILIFDQMTQLDATGPFETLVRIPGAAAARKIQLMIQYDPKPPFHAGTPRQAGKRLTQAHRRTHAKFQAARAAIVALAAARLRR